LLPRKPDNAPATPSLFLLKSAILIFELKKVSMRNAKHRNLKNGATSALSMDYKSKLV
jgi:hypothetical protein